MPHQPMRSACLSLLLALCLASPLIAGSEGAGVFEKLKSLEGSWEGAPSAEAPDATPIHEFRVSANGSVVMETMFKGTDHEMINMFHLVGEDLRITHYCAQGNQPVMKMVRTEEDGSIVFDFIGGTNFDPSKDSHIHGAVLDFVDEDTLKSSWTAYADGVEAHRMEFVLKRQPRAAR